MVYRSARDSVRVGWL